MDDFWGGIMFASIIWVLIFIAVTNGKDDSWREQIVSHGAATYYLDQNHERQWNWTK